MALGLCGGAIFAWAGLPAPWLAGSMFFVATAALAGRPVAVPPRVRDGTFVLVGASMGAAVTPETIRQVAKWPLSMLLLALSVVATIAAVSLYLERVRGWDRATARFSSVPGALTSVLILATASAADVPRVAFAQTLRVVVLVAIIPPLVGYAGGSGGQPALALWRPDSALELALLLAASAAGGWLCLRLRVPAGTLLGAMLTSATLHGSGILTAALPGVALIACFTITGAIAGERFKGTRFAVFRAAMRGAVEGVALAVLLTSFFAGAGTLFLGVPFGQMFLALAPGALDVMSIMALMLHLDPAFVGAHHIARLMGLSLLAPMWMPRRVVDASGPVLDRRHQAGPEPN